TTATGRPVLKSEELAMSDDVTPSSLVRRHVRRPFNYTVNTHGQDFHSDSDSDSELDLDEADFGRRDPPSMELVSLIWFSSEAQPSSPLHTQKPWCADVYPDIEKIILSAVRKKAPWGVGTVINSSGLYYLERSMRSDRYFYFEFYLNRPDDFHPVSIEGGGPFTGTLPASVPPKPFETHVWFTDVGTQRGPNSHVRLFSGHTGLTLRNVNQLSGWLHNSVLSEMPELNIDKHIMVFREECQPEHTQFHLQVFRRDENGMLPVASKHGGPYTSSLIDACKPRASSSVRLPLRPDPPPPPPPPPPGYVPPPPRLTRPLEPISHPVRLGSHPVRLGLHPVRLEYPPPVPVSLPSTGATPPRPASPESHTDRNHASSPGSEFEEDEPPTDRLVCFVWFSSEAQPNSTQRTLSPRDADVYQDIRNLIFTAVVQKSTPSGTVTDSSGIFYLERLIRSDRHFYLKFYLIPHDDPHPVSIEGGGPFRHELPDSVPEHPFETHVWFTDAGRQRGPNSDVRLFSEHTGLSYSNVNHIIRQVPYPIMPASDRDQYSVVFREECEPGKSQFHFQTFRRDQNGILVAINNGGGPFTLPEACEPRDGSVRLPLPGPHTGAPLLRPVLSRPGLASPPPRPVVLPLRPASPPRMPLSPPRSPISPPLTPVSPSPPPKPESPHSRPASPEAHADESDASSMRPAAPGPHINTNLDASHQRTGSTGPRVDRNDASPSNAASHESHTDENGTHSRRPASPRPHINANSDASPPRITSPGPRVNRNGDSVSRAASHEAHTDENGTRASRPASPRPHNDASSLRPASPGPHNNKNGAV
ncbi:hypothetical protein EV361DRAFT_942510, partial [Lentinula raphanica]